jgi:hypothetical protein
MSQLFSPFYSRFIMERAGPLRRFGREEAEKQRRKERLKTRETTKTCGEEG